jgi:mannonate dehydratase
MNLSDQNLFLLEEGFRWFGPGDPVPPAYIRQAGASAVFSSLHQIPSGELWPREAIRERVDCLKVHGLKWAVVESVPVHEAIKTGNGDLKRLFANYTQTLRNLALEGITTVIYNFMPVLDWIRTDMRRILPDGSESLGFDPVRFAAFELLVLKRSGAEADYSPEQIEAAKAWWSGLDGKAREGFIQNIIDVFPGCKLGLDLDDVRAMLASYSHLREGGLADNLARFHEAIIPTAEAVGVRMAIHPDDPPFPALGLPRIVSTAEDVRKMMCRVDSPANGLCFCTGSFSARPSNDLPAMAREFAPRIHSAHLRSTQRLPDGSFFEADHLAGSVPMPEIVSLLLAEQDRRRAEGRADWQLTFRPDHGHTMMDDLSKEFEGLPGYTCIGRMRGLAELRGLMLGLRYGQPC